ncbi:2-polyprenyl-6-methoxyphenol hydroxylase [Polaromonas sp. OV174]|uniref:FAD-dependent monooxygenase n=1 Tax=Polaromonas sp. OV174 TaxID=1855300 RepID=UPI0008E0F764|nr:FAD-dependent monooxygenase [Polaromonas sp. OV174]SFC16222.1 2-polyprenyl-6-methoxyphenol hydroxylase [Polaromonas sp. OV174]
MSCNVDLETPILIAGGGSSGLTLAGELGWRNTPCMVVDPALTVNPHPRANAVANRSMEYFRRWGTDRTLIGAGVPSDYPAAYYWVSTLRGHEVHSLQLPSHNDLEAMRRDGPTDPRSELHWSPYLKTIVGQNEVEQMLRNHAATRPSVTQKYGWALESFTEQADCVMSVIRHMETGRQQTVRSQWLVGCDGGRSVVRESLGIGLSGRAALANFISIYFRAPEFMSKHKFGPANIYFPLHKDHCGFLLNWDTGKTWTYHLILKPGQDWQSIDPKAAITALLGCETALEVVSVQPWTAHALTANQYQSPGGRVLIAGDAAHLFTPTGGLGMNTGVSDVIDLAWKLGACAAGWAGDGLLRSYETERRPIGIRNTMEAADNFDKLHQVMKSGDVLDDDGPDGMALRATLKRDLISQEKLLKSSGVLLGYRYEDSPIGWSDGTEAPPDNPLIYTPTARPGHRAPHAWVGQDKSILDLFGAWFTLISFNGDNEIVKIFQQAAMARGVPLSVQFVDDSAVRELYGNRHCVLIRPDMMVGWRGDTAPDAFAVIDRLRGA